MLENKVNEPLRGSGALTLPTRIARLWLRLFPARQILVRSQGRVRYLQLGSLSQSILSACFLITLGSLVYGTAANHLKAREVAGRDARIAELTTAYDRLSSNMAALHDRYGGITGELEHKQQLLIRALQQREELQRQLGELDDTLQAADRRLADAESERLRLQSEIDEMRAELLLTEGERVRLADNLEELSSQLQQTAHQRDVERQQRERLSNSLIALRQRLDDVENTRSSLADSLAERTERLQRLAQERDGAERQRRTLAALLDDLQDQMAGVEGARAELETVLSEQNNRVAALRHERDLAQRRSVALGKRVTRLESRLADLSTSQQDVVKRIRERTDESIEGLESIVAMTGLKLDRLLERVSANNEGVGGPLVGKADDRSDGSDPSAADEVEQSIAHLEARLNRWSAINRVLERLPISTPVNHYRISSTFGKRRDPFTKKSAFHSGVDLAGVRNTRVRSTSPGVVTFVGWKGPYGRLVEIDHGFGVKTRYGHLAKILVKNGAKVSHRQPIGLMGSTGRSTGTHVHYEVLFDGKPVDPMKFLEAGRHVFKQG